jgi:uncharacterized alkaline shock family protein YloU
MTMTEKTSLGKIEVSPTAIASLASRAVLESYGVVAVWPSYSDEIPTSEESK